MHGPRHAADHGLTERYRELPMRGVSIRDIVFTGPSLDQPAGIQ